MVRHLSIGRCLVPLALLSMLLGLVAPFAVAADSSTYTDPGGVYSFTQPDGWQASPPDPLGITFTNAATGTTLQISTSPTNGVSLNDQMQQALALFQSLPGYEAGPGGMTDVTLGGQPGKAVTYHSNDIVSGKPTSTAVVAVVYKDTTYALTFETPRENESASDADVTTILTSWQFT